ncbi:outer membrane beta-barrel protein [Putridiphycobacter roseus]|uniref:type IX secretion/gliding motility protein PorT/SprT n=1 Tax=Putridiphycobacter roseus TaxID=2219161 RepID=UPI0013140065|nr:outer membrane beta-barrel protein [Putridiphycobacter roseus]
MKIQQAILFCALLIGASNVYGQPGKNYPQFDRKNFHFGFALGGNSADYRYTFQPGMYNGDSIVSININKQAGFTLGIISSWDVHEMFHIRFIPSLSFQEREFNYGLLRNKEVNFETYRLESTFLDFPLMMKLRSKRINNFAAYGLAGIQYSVDLASQRDVVTVPGEAVMKMKKHDLSTQFGGGFDFFMAYYKFAIEIKISNGFQDLLIQENTLFSAPLNSLRSKVWWFTITFEG